MENTLLSLPGRDTTPFFMRDLRIKLKKMEEIFMYKELKPNDVFPDAPGIAELDSFLKSIDIGFEIVDNPTLWCAYSIHYAFKQGLDTITSSSFGSMVSLFLADMCVSAGTDAYFYEERIENAVIDYMNANNFEDEIEQAEGVFNFIFNIYSNPEEIGQYQKKVVRLDFRIGWVDNLEFNKVGGATKTEKFINLIRNYKK